MEEYDFSLTNNATAIEPLQKELQTTLQAGGLRLHFISALNVALGEWLENVIQYAYPDGGTHRIEVQCRLSETELIVRVIDDGREFDPAHFPDTSARASGENVFAARGLHLIRNLMDHVGHERVNGRNVLVLTKRLAR
jgi:serine/threonine-protein kinase RsbW